MLRCSHSWNTPSPSSFSSSSPHIFLLHVKLLNLGLIAPLTFLLCSRLHFPESVSFSFDFSTSNSMGKPMNSESVNTRSFNGLVLLQLKMIFVPRLTPLKHLGVVLHGERDTGHRLPEELFVVIVQANNTNLIRNRLAEEKPSPNCPTMEMSLQAQMESVRALALARSRKNCAVSSDHRSPTSAVSTTERALPPSPESSGENGLLGASGLMQRCSVAVCRCPPGGAIPVQRRHQRGVYGELCPVPQRQAVRDDFESPPIEHVDPCRVQVTDRSVGPHSLLLLCTPVPRRAPMGTLARPRPPPAQDPRHTARRSMWPNESRWRPHRQVREVKGRGNLRRRKRSKWKGWTSTSPSCWTAVNVARQGTALIPH